MSDPNKPAEVILIIIKRLFKWFVIGTAGLLIISTIAIGGYYIYEEYKQQKIAEESELRKRDIEASRSTATAEGKQWRLHLETDPASGEKIARRASVISNDGLCRLQVEERLNGTKLTGVFCRQFRIERYKGVEVKFGYLETSNTMPLETFSNSDDVYIPSSSYKYDKENNYDAFINRLKTGEAVALKTEAFEGYWVKFTLKDAAISLSNLGKSFSNLKTPD